MYRNERPGLFRHRLYSEKPSESPPTYPPSFSLRCPSFFPRRRILIPSRFPNQGTRPFVRHPNSLIDYRSMGRHLMRSRYPAPQSCNNLKSKSMESFEIPFTQSNNLENINMNSISLTSSVPQKENFDTHKVEFFGKDMQYSDDLWIETTAPNGRVYFYNASSRVSRWDKPENVKIMTLDHIRVLANAPHINPIQNTNMEPIYAPLNQQPHLRFLPPPQAATGAPSSMFMFPPPNLNTPPPFQARTAPIPNMLDVPLFHVYNSDVYTDICMKEEANFSADKHLSFSSHEAVAMNQPYFDDILQNIQISNETGNISEEREVTAVEFHENYSDDIKIHQSQEEQVSLNEANGSVPEEMDESNIRNSPVKDSLLSPTDETQNLSSSAVDDQNSDKDNVSETIIKPIDKSRPVSSTPVPGSKWCVVWTGNGKVFFYDADRKISVWEMPNELKNRTDVQKLVESPPPAMEKKQSSNVYLSKKIKIEEEDKTALNDESQTMEYESTKALIAEAVKKREELPHETRVQMFLQMLSEKNVSAFSTMEKEIHKVVHDSRYLLLPYKERKQKFQSYLREKSEEERNAKKKQALKIKEEYKNFLQVAGVTKSTRFVDFAHLHFKDPRFKALEKMKDREALFNEYVNSLRKKCHDSDEKRKIEFIELLKEQNYINGNSNWSDVKKRLCFDNRYSSISSKYEKEKLFNEYIQKHYLPEFHFEKEKEDKINASIKTREQEVERELSFHLKELNKERENHKYDAIVSSFKALLADLVKKPEISWREAKKILRADHRWADVRDLRDERRMHYFDEHISYLTKKKREQFRQILTEMPEITLTSSWKDVKKNVLNDPRSKLFSSDSKKYEREFKEYISEKLMEAKNEFKELLKETKIITHASKNLMKTSNHLENIEKALEQDQRYLILKCVEKERKEMLLCYIDKLHHKGPPPPPTAADCVKH